MSRVDGLNLTALSVPSCTKTRCPVDRVERVRAALDEDLHVAGVERHHGDGRVAAGAVA
jgi:hypothetical protein